MKKMLGTVQKAAPILICLCLNPLLVPLHGEGLQLLQLLGAQTNTLSLEGDGHDLWGHGLRWGKQDMGANHHHCGRFLWLYMGNCNAAYLLLQPDNSSSLVWLGQDDSGCAERLIVPTQ